MPEAERRSLYHLIYAGANINASIEHLRQMLKKGDEKAKALLSPDLLDIYHSKPMRVKNESARGTRTNEEIRRNKNFFEQGAEAHQKPMRVLPKSTGYCGPIRRKSYSYVSWILRIAHNRFVNEENRECFFDYEQAVLLAV